MLRRLFLLCIISFSAGCNDPLVGVDPIDKVEIGGAETTSDALPTNSELAREGFFGTEAATADTGVSLPVAPKSRRGLLGVFRRAPEGGRSANVSQPSLTRGPDVRSLEPVSAPTPVTAEPRKRGLFGGGKRGTITNGPDARDVPFGTVLPFGEVARSCAARGQPLGQMIEKAPQGGYALYDSNPTSTGLRTFYITGFDDKCPRQLTAGNVLLGTIRLYEQLHYGPGGENLPIAETDHAYERVKHRVCGAGRGRPCGSKIKKLERSTLFVSAYESLGSTKQWKELLIHDGTVVASAVKRNE